MTQYWTSQLHTDTILDKPSSHWHKTGQANFTMTQNWASQLHTDTKLDKPTSQWHNTRVNAILTDSCWEDSFTTHNAGHWKIHTDNQFCKTPRNIVNYWRTNQLLLHKRPHSYTWNRKSQLSFLKWKNVRPCDRYLPWPPSPSIYRYKPFKQLPDSFRETNYYLPHQQLH